jgi:hypothetical protein
VPPDRAPSAQPALGVSSASSHCSIASRR